MKEISINEMKKLDFFQEIPNEQNVPFSLFY